MLIENTEYLHRVNGIPLYYSTSRRSSLTPYTIYATPSPPLFDFSMSSKNISLPPDPINTLTPPLSPYSSSMVVCNDKRRRDSVIMKVENCQITPAAPPPNENQQINIQHVCRWENCYR